MKARIVKNEFGGVHSEKWINDNVNLIIGGQLVSEWQLTEILPSSEIKLPQWNGTEWIEGYVEIIVVPASISRMKLSIELLKRNISFNDIIASINSIPSNLFSELDKKIAIVKFEQAVTFDRYNADLNLIATMEGLTQTDVDNIFINGNLIV